MWRFSFCCYEHDQFCEIFQHIQIGIVIVFNEILKDVRDEYAMTHTRLDRMCVLLLCASISLLLFHITIDESRLNIKIDLSVVLQRFDANSGYVISAVH